MIEAGKTYDQTLSSLNAIGARPAFTGTSYTWTASRLNLSSLAGQTVKFRFRVGTDYAVGYTGWYVDDVAIYRCSTGTPPTLSVDLTSAPPGTPVTTTLTNGLGGATDWLTLATVGAPDTSHGAWAYVGSGVTTRTWTTAVPQTGGPFEFRLFANNGYQKLATSPAITLTSDNPVPAITTLNPANVIAGGSQFTLTVNGSGFVNGAVVKFDGSDRSTAFASANQLAATILAADIASAATHTISVFNPTPGGGTSNGSTLTVTAPPAAPTITSTNPSTVAVGSAGLTLTVNGANFVNTSVVKVNGNSRTTTYGSANQITATIPASDFISAGTLAITVVTPAPGGGTSNTVNVTVTGPTLAVSKTSTTPGTADVTVTLTNWGGGAKDWMTVAKTTDPNTTYGTWLYVFGAGGPGAAFTWTPAMPSQPGTYEFRLFANDGFTRLATSPAVTVTSSNPTPTLAFIDPTTVVSGAASFPLTAHGTGYVNGSVIEVNGVSRFTTFVSANEISALVDASEIASTGTRSITVRSPAPGGGQSSAQTLTVVAPPAAPAITSITPSSVPVGSGTTSIHISGSGFVSTSIAYVDGVPHSSFYSSQTGELTAILTANDFLQAGTRSLTVVTPAPGGGTSTAVPLTVTGPLLTVDHTTSLPGASTVTMTLTGGPGGAQDWLAIAPVGAANTSYLTWSYVGAGVTTRTWNPAMPATPGSYEFRLFANNGYTRLATSPTITVAAANPIPVVTSLTPATITAGSGAISLTVNGSSFVSGSIVRIDGANRTTTYGSPTQLTASLLAGDLASAGAHTITVFSPTPGGGTSSGAVLTVTATGPTLSVNATSTTTGATNVVVTLTNGLGGTEDWLTIARTSDPNTIYGAWTYVGGGVTTRTWSPTMPATPGTYEFRLFANNGYTRLATGPTISVLSPNPQPTISSITPVSQQAQSYPPGPITIYGTGFVPESVGRLDGAPRATTYVSPTELSMEQLDSDIAAPATQTVTVFSPAPGGGTSNGAIHTVTAINPVPVITSLNPGTVTAGAPGFTLTINGQNFIVISSVFVGSAYRAATYISSTQVTVPVSASDILNPGALPIVVVTPTPGGGYSNAVNLTISQ